MIWLRNLVISILGEKVYNQIRDHLREQLKFAVILGAWLGMLCLIDFIVADRVIPYIEISLAEPLDFLEDISLIFGLLMSLVKAFRKEWRDK